MSQSQTASVAATRRQAGLLVALAYAAFISLGLPDGLIGVGWPSIRQTYGLPIDALGALLITFTIGYLVSSATSGWLLARLGVGMLLVLSCVATATALLFYGLTLGWWVMIAFGIFSGLGAGAIDAGLNTYAANNFDARTMNWLHASFGIGAVTGPAIMTVVLTSGQRWRAGFAIVGAVLLALVGGFVLTRGLWRGPGAPARSAQHPARGATLAETLRQPVTWLGIVLFFAYTGAEIGAGQWTYSLLTEARGVSATLAGTWVSLYWASLTLGRILFGFVVHRMSSITLLRCCLGAGVLGALLIWLDLALWLTLGAIGLMGMALAPQFPLLISATPGYLGQRHAANGVGFQVAAASLGGAVLPALIGVLARARGLEVLGPFLLVVMLIMAALFELLARRMREA